MIKGHADSSHAERSARRPSRRILDTEQIREGLAALSPGQRETVGLVYSRGG
jgi:hypothetical protein